MFLEGERFDLSSILAALLQLCQLYFFFAWLANLGYLKTSMFYLFFNVPP